MRLLLILALVAACSGARTRDVAGDRRRGGSLPADSADAGETGVAPPPPPPEADMAKGASALKVLVKATTRALAVDGDRVYYGNESDDAVYAVPKAGGDAVRIGRRAPVSGALAVAGDFVAWVATPGDAVLRAPKAGGGEATTLREKGIFTDVALSSGDAFVTEVLGEGGTLTRIGEASSTRIATFDTPPRELYVDAESVYVVTATKLLRTPRAGTASAKDVVTLLEAPGLSSPELDAGFVYVNGPSPGGSRLLLRVAKDPRSGPSAVLAASARYGPVVLDHDEIFYFQVQPPSLVAIPKAGGTPRVVAIDDALARPVALAVDAKNAFIALGEGEGGVIVSVPR